jgi:hypothetical protein
MKSIYCSQQAASEAQKPRISRYGSHRGLKLSRLVARNTRRVAGFWKAMGNLTWQLLQSREALLCRKLVIVMFSEGRAY